MEGMEVTRLVLVAAGILVVAFLYSSVGHAGASGYIAVLTLAGLAPASIKPTALVLNILVASVASFQFWRAGHFNFSLFWPFAVMSVPAAFLGGAMQLSPRPFKILVGVVLVLSAVRLWLRQGDPPEVKPPPRPLAFGVGAGIGLMSGLTGTGGGIFLTPLLLFCKWAITRRAAAVSALFILLNSMSGLAGYVSSGKPVPALAWGLAGVAVAGGVVGSHLGSRRLPVRAIQILLSAVLLIAGTKLIATP